METKQPRWKFACGIGDINPIDYGGGIVYQDTTGVYDPELVYFEPASDKEWHNDKKNCKVTIYRLILERDITREWWYKELPEIAKYAGFEVKDIKPDMSIQDKAILYSDLISYFGAYEFDQYPIVMTQREAEVRYRKELKTIRSK